LLSCRRPRPAGSGGGRQHRSGPAGRQYGCRAVMDHYAAGRRWGRWSSWSSGSSGCWSAAMHREASAFMARPCERCAPPASTPAGRSGLLAGNLGDHQAALPQPDGECQEFAAGPPPAGRIATP